MKKYKFTISHGIDKIEIVEVEEKDLTQPQKDLLLGELIKVWENTPTELKYVFCEKAIFSKKKVPLTEQERAIIDEEQKKETDDQK